MTLTIFGLRIEMPTLRLFGTIRWKSFKIYLKPLEKLSWGLTLTYSTFAFPLTRCEKSAGIGSCCKAGNHRSREKRAFDLFFIYIVNVLSSRRSWQSVYREKERPIKEGPLQLKSRTQRGTTFPTLERLFSVDSKIVYPYSIICVSLKTSVTRYAKTAPRPTSLASVKSYGRFRELRVSQDRCLRCLIYMTFTMVEGP